MPLRRPPKRRRPPLRLLPRPAALCVVHTDCGPGNLVAAPDGRVVVIDWQAAGAGDPVADAVTALQQLGYKPAEAARMAREAAAPGDEAATIIRKALQSALR